MGLITEKKIGVLMGGLSAEREVSLKSGDAILKALKDMGYNAVGIDVDRNLPEELKKETIEFAFIALHGRYGEDGVVQAVLELMGIPYTGSGFMASALGMNKVFSKKIFEFHKLPVGPYYILEKKKLMEKMMQLEKGVTVVEDEGAVTYEFNCPLTAIAGDDLLMRNMSKDASHYRSRNTILDKIKKFKSRNKQIDIEEITKDKTMPDMRKEFTPTVMDLGFPVVVKPVSEGSSVGVSIVSEEKGLKDAFALAFKYGKEILIEKYIKGREIQVGILGKKALGAIEIIPKKAFYDYEAKYTANMAEHIFPAPLPKELYKNILDLGLAAHKALGCRGYSRVDMLIDSESRPFLLEVNTLPGMTNVSLLPEIARGVGIEFNRLVEMILMEALKEDN